jgi:hypothetical protein
MRRAAKVDTNQAAIVAAARAVGCSAYSLAPLGRGCPDVVLGLLTHHGRLVNLLLEIKDGTKSPSRRQLSPDEQAWHAAWRGQVAVVTSVEEALALIQWAQEVL